MILLLRSYCKKIMYACVFSLVCVASVLSRQLNVLMVVPKFPKIHDVCMLNQMKGLLERGHNLTIYAPSAGDTTLLQEDVIKYDLLSKTIIADDLPDNLDQFDVVVFQLGHKAVNIKKLRQFKGKVVICLRGYDITGFIKENPHAYDEFFEDCDLFMPVCESFKKILINLGCNPDKIVVHHSGIDADRFFFSHRPIKRDGIINILSAGRYVEKKGFVYSIRAVARLIRKYPKIRYTIIGNGKLKKEYLSLIKKLGMAGKIRLVDWYKHDDYIAVLQKTHIFLAPSVTGHDDDQEGIPNVLKEAMSMGVVVVATIHSGNPELIQNRVSGFLVPERRSQAIARSILYILQNPHILPSMQRAARHCIEQEFDNKVINDRLEKIFLHLVESTR